MADLDGGQLTCPGCGARMSAGDARCAQCGAANDHDPWRPGPGPGDAPGYAPGPAPGYTPGPAGGRPFGPGGPGGPGVPGPPAGPVARSFPGAVAGGGASNLVASAWGAVSVAFG